MLRLPVEGTAPAESTMNKWKITKLAPSDPPVPNRIVRLEDGTVELQAKVDEATLEDLRYLQELLSEERGRAVDPVEAIEYALETFLRIEMESRTRNMPES